MSTEPTPRIVVENAVIATVDAADTEYASGHIVVAGNRIESVGPGPAPEVEGVVRRVDASGHLVTPGLVNTHHHFYQWITRGLAQNAILFDWLVELARGANVVTAQDDVNDPYYPFGKPDPLECASMIAHVAQLTLPHELEQVVDMITVNSARAARVPDYGIGAGCRADLVVVGAPSVHEALRLQPLRRHVLKDGREIARSTATQELLP